MLRQVVNSLLLPPGCTLVLAAAGALLWWRRPRLGRGLVLVAGLLLWALATPVVAGFLLTSLQTAPALPTQGELPPAEAIVVLSAEAEAAAPEYPAPAPGRDTLIRLRYAAALHRRTGVPILVTGGPPRADAPAVGVAMQAALEAEFELNPRWVEVQARSTWDNAAGAAPMLQADGIQSVYLVTHAWHMPRAQACFEAQGLVVVPAPTGFRAAPWQGPASLLPSWPAVRDSAYAFHEWVGRGFYAIVYL
ncbi:YdcF family protein [Haliangium sp.]|uniref:YdcF family protein n=1 Tax=Haliangium sp. TaxID=2663208 RepID=UPI003D101BD9